MRIKTWAVAGIAAVALAGCGASTTPEGLAEALQADGVGLDPDASAERYYAAVQDMCEVADLSPNDEVYSSRMRGFTHEDNRDAARRMYVGMKYQCAEEGDRFFGAMAAVHGVDVRD